MPATHSHARCEPKVRTPSGRVARAAGPGPVAAGETPIPAARPPAATSVPAAIAKTSVNEVTLFALQRLTAKLLAPLVLVHLVLIMYAVHGGLSAAEILGRTQGSVLWGAFYALFVAAVAVHAPIGVRNVVREWTRWQGRSLDAASLALAITLLWLGLRAVVAVVG